jgi:hypothetical protein
MLSTSKHLLPVHWDKRWAVVFDRAFAASAGGFCGKDRQTKAASYSRLRSWLLGLNTSSVCGCGPSITRSTPATKSCQSFRGFRHTSGGMPYRPGPHRSCSVHRGQRQSTSGRDPVGNSVSALRAAANHVDMDRSNWFLRVVGNWRRGVDLSRNFASGRKIPSAMEQRSGLADQVRSFYLRNRIGCF